MNHADSLDSRIVRPGFTVSLELVAGGRVAIVASAGHIATSWEYHNFVTAMAAWQRWDPLSNAEPPNFIMRRDASSKVIQEVL